MPRVNKPVTVYPALFKFSNGAVMEELFSEPAVPDVLKVHFSILSGRPEERVYFWFRFVDQLPSGTAIYRETTEQKAIEMLRGM